MTATHPWPLRWVLNSPPVSIPAPCTRWMSHSSDGSKASTFFPFTDSALPARCSTCTWSASLARNTSPSPLQRISGTPSPVAAFLMKRPIPPEPSWSKSTRPWNATIDPWRASTGSPRRTLSSREFWRTTRAPEPSSA